MNFKSLLDQVMASGGDMAKQAQQATRSSGMSDMTKGALGGAVGGSLLTMLAGSKKSRKMGKKAAKLGGAAAFGALAYKVFNDWQAKSGQPADQSMGQPSYSNQQATHQQPSYQQPAGQQPVQQPQRTASNYAAETYAPQGTAMQTGPAQTEQHAMVLLKAMIAAAKADGHVDDEERARIHQAIQSLGATAEVSAFVDGELNKPLDPADIARDVNCPEQAAEVYLASVIMVDEQNFMERAYLRELAGQLRLQPDLVAQLEANAPV